MKIFAKISIIFVVLVFGYIWMFYSLVSKAHPTKHFRTATVLSNEEDIYQIKRLKTIIENQSHQIDELKSDIRRKLDKLNLKSATYSRLMNSSASRPGVIVLGMHRSGTSIVGGLLTKMGLNVGGPLIGAAEDNTKGFFERTDVVLQNDWLFRKQKVHYSAELYKYDALQGLKDIFTDKGEVFWNFVSAEEGRKALKFFNNPENYPWMMKDPRLCVTIRTWLPQLKFIPAVLFTYRHPLDVALSMHKRESEQFQIGRAMRMWYVYNKRAVQQSHDLCRVISSHSRIMASPRDELDRIFDELSNCGVPMPYRASQEDINAFIDTSLQHGKTALLEKSCSGDADVRSTLVPPSNSWDTQDPAHLDLYREAIRVYCAMDDGSAFVSAFLWDESIHD